MAVARKRLNLLKPQKSLIPPKGHLKKAKTSRQGILQEIERQQKSSDAVVETSFFLSPLKRHRNNFNNFMNNYTSERCLEFDSYRESAPNYFQLVLVTLVALFEELKYRYFLVVLQKNCTQTTIKSSQHFYCLQLYLTSNVSTADFNMGYSMTGTLERGYKSSNSFQMTHFAVIRRRDYDKWTCPRTSYSASSTAFSIGLSGKRNVYRQTNFHLRFRPAIGFYFQNVKITRGRSPWEQTKVFSMEIFPVKKFGL